MEAKRVKEEGYKMIEERLVDEMHMNEDTTNWNQLLEKWIVIDTDSESLFKGINGYTNKKIEMSDAEFLHFKWRESEATLIKSAIL